MYESLWEKYANEFRAFWLGSSPHPIRPWVPSQPDEQDRFGSDTKPGGTLKVSGHPELKSDPNCQADISLQLKNEKQTNIARRILGSYGGMEQAFLCSQVFRQRLLDLDHGESVNFVNSVRIEKLHRQILRAKHKTIWGTDPDPASVIFWVVQFVKDLDEVDLSSLRDPDAAAKPFWDDARTSLDKSLFQWMEDYIVRRKTDVPPPEASNYRTAVRAATD
jgi:hypothetical protein